jgi:hypothetical protein
MTSPLRDALEIRSALTETELDIYAPLTRYPELVYTKEELETLLSHELRDQVFDAPLKTRAKLIKQATAASLGYPIPKTLKRTKPRFPGQDLEVCSQQSDNLQIWNDEISPTRRYAVVGLDAQCRVFSVRVVEGTELAPLDRTGTLTSKFQAKRLPDHSGDTLVVDTDTDPFIRELAPVDSLSAATLASMHPGDTPAQGRVLTVHALFRQLRSLVGTTLPDSPSERLRGEGLHRAVCDAVGLSDYSDPGVFPDIPCQALEVKLQTAGTIDLGLVSPSSEDPALTLSPRLRHCDTRYLVAYASRRGDDLFVDEIVLSTGVAFFEEFRLFGGLGQNKKLQLRLPRGFFQSEQAVDDVV